MDDLEKNAICEKVPEPRSVLGILKKVVSFRDYLCELCGNFRSKFRCIDLINTVLGVGGNVFPSC